MLDIVILAAGKGTRMKSALPKVLHPVGGKPLLQHVVDTAKRLSATAVHLVVGHGAEQVQTQMAGQGLTFSRQEQQLGTGHAVMQAMDKLQGDGVVLILYGDVPLISTATLELLLAQVTAERLGLLTVNLQDPTGYGRILRDNQGDVLAIVEQKDATPEQLRIREGNSGVMAMHTACLRRWLPLLSNQNAQGEYYLTDVIALAVKEGVKIAAVTATDELEVLGVNNRQQQAQLERAYQMQQADALMRNGLTLRDPARFDLRGSLEVGQDCIVDVNVVFEGDNRLADGVYIGPNCTIKNASIGPGVQIYAGCVIENAVIEQGCTVGPMARLRPGTHLKAEAKIGNFVEVKKAVIGEGSKVSHLSYIGDAVLGADVNVGAGTITCNYDGVNKHITQIGDNCFVGANSTLVAPIKVGDNATIAAGSTITTHVQKDELVVARTRQRHIEGWQRPSKKK
jgi:bifunctional UDP-N-acetylglucosamine pyrophosphorylase / glucosamine-1-phosphate N-acetyltransferase